MRFLLTLSLLLTTLQAAVHLELSKNVVSDAVKKDILNLNDNDAFTKYMTVYSDVEPPALTLSAQPSLKKQVRAQEKKTFLKNIKQIKKHNKQYKRGETTYEMSVNTFTAMDEENRGDFLGMNISESASKHETVEQFKVSTRGSLPSSLDWKKRGWMTAMKSQGSCGSCWSYPTIALIEFAYKVSTGNLLQLSEQEVLDCTYESIRGKDGCNGGSYEAAWKVIIASNHVAKMSDYKYKGKDGYCYSRSYTNAIRNVLQVKSYARVRTGESYSMQVLQETPIAVAFQVEDAFYNVGQGIYDGCRNIGQRANHAVTLTGYTGQYWEMKNSWGADWGIKGYGRFQRGRGSICNLLTYGAVIVYTDLNRRDGMDPTDQDNWTEPDEDDGGGEVCEDKHTECPNWAQHYCTTGKYTDYMEGNCRLSCGFCGDCKDEYTDCAMWHSEYNYCNAGQYTDWMKKNCCRTCGGGGSKCGGGLKFCNGVCKHEHMCR